MPRRIAPEQRLITLIEIAAREPRLTESTTRKITAFLKKDAPWLLNGTFEYSEGEYEHTPLSLAVELGALPVVKLLLTLGAIPDITPLLGDPILFWAINPAADVSNVEMMKALLDHTPDPIRKKQMAEMRLPNSSTLMALCAEEGLHKTAEVLYQVSPQLIYMTDKRGSTPLHVALNWGQHQMSLFLLENEADPNAKDYRGYTPLMAGLVSPRCELKNLISIINNYPQKFDFYAKDIYGNSILTFVKKYFEARKENGENPQEFIDFLSKKMAPDKKEEQIEAQPEKIFKNNKIKDCFEKIKSTFLLNTPELSAEKIVSVLHKKDKDFIIDLFEELYEEESFLIFLDYVLMRTSYKIESYASDLFYMFFKNISLHSMHNNMPVILEHILSFIKRKIENDIEENKKIPIILEASCIEKLSFVLEMCSNNITSKNIGSLKSIIKYTSPFITIQSFDLIKNIFSKFFDEIDNNEDKSISYHEKRIFILIEYIKIIYSHYEKTKKSSLFRYLERVILDARESLEILGKEFYNYRHIILIINECAFYINCELSKKYSDDKKLFYLEKVVHLYTEKEENNNFWPLKGEEAAQKQIDFIAPLYRKLKPNLNAEKRTTQKPYPAQTSNITPENINEKLIRMRQSEQRQQLLEQQEAILLLARRKEEKIRQKRIKKVDSMEWISEDVPVHLKWTEHDVRTQYSSILNTNDALICLDRPGLPAGTYWGCFRLARENFKEPSDYEVFNAKFNEARIRCSTKANGIVFADDHYYLRTGGSRGTRVHAQCYQIPHGPFLLLFTSDLIMDHKKHVKYMETDGTIHVLAPIPSPQPTPTSEPR